MPVDECHNLESLSKWGAFDLQLTKTGSSPCWPSSCGGLNNGSVGRTINEYLHPTDAQSATV